MDTAVATADDDLAHGGFGRIYNPDFVANAQARAEARARGEREAEAIVARARGEAEQIVGEAHAKAREILDAAWRVRLAATADGEAGTGTDRPEIGARPKKPSALAIMQAVAAEHGCDVDDLTGPRQMRRLVVARHAAMRAVHDQRPDLSLPQIGRLFGNRDHTTVFHALGRTKRGQG